MSRKPVVPREQARRGIDKAVDWYLTEAGEKAALGFIDAVERAFAQISKHPSAGSPRFGHELDLAGPRSWPLKRYPYLVFYVEGPHGIDVWRILHGERDIPVSLHESEGG